MKVEDKPLTMPPAEKTEEVWQPENDFGTGILPGFQPPRPAERGRHETARFQRGSPVASPPLTTPSVSRILRRAARSRVRLTEPALSLKQRASDASLSLS